MRKPRASERNAAQRAGNECLEDLIWVVSSRRGAKRCQDTRIESASGRIDTKRKRSSGPCTRFSDRECASIVPLVLTPMEISSPGLLMI